VFEINATLGIYFGKLDVERLTSAAVNELKPSPKLMAPISKVLCSRQYLAGWLAQQCRRSRVIGSNLTTRRLLLLPLGRPENYPILH
jgi:hypothetical protein